MGGLCPNPPGSHDYSIVVLFFLIQCRDCSEFLSVGSCSTTGHDDRCDSVHDQEMVEFGNLTGDNFDDFVPCCLVKGVCKNFDAGTPDAWSRSAVCT